MQTKGCRFRQKAYTTDGWRVEPSHRAGADLKLNSPAGLTLVGRDDYDRTVLSPTVASPRQPLLPPDNPGNLAL